jgi:hypothetical protein
MRPIKSLFLCVCLGACATPPATVETTSATIPALERYRTFSFDSASTPPSGYRSSARGPEVVEIAQPLIADALERKGFTHTDQDGDLVVVVSVGRRVVDQTKPLSRTSVVITGDRYETIRIPEGAIHVDAYDRRTRAEVWRGAATDEVDFDASNLDRARAVRTIDSIVSRFPSR